MVATCAGGEGGRGNDGGWRGWCTGRSNHITVSACACVVCVLGVRVRVRVCAWCLCACLVCMCLCVLGVRACLVCVCAWLCIMRRLSVHGFPPGQGVLSLIDNREEDGGFQCVPMADPTAWLLEWTAAQSLPTGSRPQANGRHIFSAAEFAKLGLPKTRVPCPAGSLILFNNTLPHGTLPNRSGRPRAVQFLRWVSVFQGVGACVCLCTRSSCG